MEWYHWVFFVVLPSIILGLLTYFLVLKKFFVDKELENVFDELHQRVKELGKAKKQNEDVNEKKELIDQLLQGTKVKLTRKTDHLKKAVE